MFIMAGRVPIFIPSSTHHVSGKPPLVIGLIFLIAAIACLCLAYEIYKDYWKSRYWEYTILILIFLSLASLCAVVFAASLS